MGEGGGTGGQNLNERVGVLDLVGVLLGVGVDPFHPRSFGGSGDSSLGGVNVVVHTVQRSANDHGGNTFEDDPDVVEFVNGTGTHGVLVQSPHGPSDRSLLGAKLGMQSFLTGSHELVVSRLGSFATGVSGRVGSGRGVQGVLDLAFLAVLTGLVGGRYLVDDGQLRHSLLVLILVVLDDGIVGNGRLGTGVRRSGAAEQERTVDEVPPLEGVVLLDHLGMNERNEEDGGEKSDTGSGSHDDRDDPPFGLLAQPQGGRTLVDDRQGAESTSNEEEEGRGVDGPGDGILSHVNNDLDEGKDDGTETGRDCRRHSESGVDGSETFSVVPSPLDLRSTDRSDTDTGDSRDERVGRGDVGRVTSAPHDPGTGSSQSTGCKVKQTDVHEHQGRTSHGHERLFRNLLKANI